jgi:hypothetical protein
MHNMERAHIVELISEFEGRKKKKAKTYRFRNNGKEGMREVDGNG